ncbi:hypothetical protein KY289_007187 [Solanum tuberosum]|nr:hypothetical protein KY289_007187 [Solanum tuberosum]
MENSLMKSPMKDEDDLPSFQEFNWEETTDDDTFDSPMKDEDDRKIVEYQWPSTNSANIWANEISQKCISDHADIRKSANYEHGSSSTYHPINQYTLGQNLSNKMLSNSCIGVQGSADYNRPPLDHNNWSTEDYSECLSYLLNQSVGKMARNPKDSRLLQKILEVNNYDHIRMLDEVLSSIYEVMIYETGHALFVKLVEFCNNEQLNLILSTFQFHVDLFLQTAFTKNGNYVVQHILKLGDIEISNKVCSPLEKSTFN